MRSAAEEDFSRFSDFCISSADEDILIIDFDRVDEKISQGGSEDPENGVVGVPLLNCTSSEIECAVSCRTDYTAILETLNQDKENSNFISRCSK